MSEQTISDERCIRCGYLIGPAKIRSWWDGIGPYHSQCTPLVDNQYQVLVAENAELKRRAEALDGMLQRLAEWFEKTAQDELAASVELPSVEKMGAYLRQRLWEEALEKLASNG